MPKATKQTTAKKRTPPDPIIRLIDVAQKRLAELREADRALKAIEEKIGEDNTHAAPIYGGLAFQHVFHTGTFMTEWGLQKSCTTAAAKLKTVIKGEAGAIKGGKLSPSQELIARQNVLDAKVDLASLPLIQAWGAREWRRERARLRKLWRETGYATADARDGAAQTAARKAVMAVAAAKPRTPEGCLAVVKFVADRTMGENMVLRIEDADAEVCAPLYRAHDVLNAASK